VISHHITITYSDLSSDCIVVSEEFVAKIVDFSHVRSLPGGLGLGRDLLAEDIYAVGLILMEMLMLLVDDEGDDSQAASTCGLLVNYYRAENTGTGGPLETAALLSAQFDALRRIPIDASTAPAAFVTLAFRCCDPRSTNRPSAAECVEECDLMLIDIGLQLDEWHYPHYRSFTPVAPDATSIPPLFVRTVRSEEPSTTQCPQPDKVLDGVQLRICVVADDAWEELDVSSSEQQEGSGMSEEEKVVVLSLHPSNAMSPSCESSSSSQFDLLIPSK